jgi:hypothetical protein
MTRPGWLAGTAAPEPKPRRPLPLPAKPAAEPPPDPAPVTVEYVAEPAPPTRPAPPSPPDPAARLRQALELLDGADLGPLPAFAMSGQRRRHNQVGHAVEQARVYLRRAVELVTRG